MLHTQVPWQGNEVHKLLLRPKRRLQHPSNKMQQVPLVALSATHVVQVPHPPRTREGEHM